MPHTQLEFVIGAEKRIADIVSRAEIEPLLRSLVKAGPHYAAVLDEDGLPICRQGGDGDDDAARELRHNLLVEGEPKGTLQVFCGAAIGGVADGLTLLARDALQLIITNNLKRMLTTEVHTAIVQESYDQLVETNRKLVESEKRYRELAVSLEQQVEARTADLQKAYSRMLQQEKLAAVGSLAAGMAHEIGTPLATIMGYAEMLGSERSDNPAVQDFSRRISQESARIDRIVRGLLDYARPRRNTSGVCRIGELLETSLDLLRQQGVFKNIQVGLTCADRLDPVLADPHQLQQVLINLMLNGRDAMTDGGRLELACANVPPPAFISSVRCVRIDVADSGTGIDPDKIDKIFDPFFTTKEPGKGTGLGLAISARIIESFGGRITVTSEPGRGSCFTVWLPSLDGQKEDV